MIQSLYPGTEFRAPDGRPFVVVAGPGEVEAEGVGLLLGGGGGQRMTQLRLAFGGVPLFAEHDVESVTEGVPAAGPGVERGQRRGMQGPDLFGLGSGGTRAVLGGQVLQQCLHHVPGRHFTPLETGPHTVGVALPEHRAPAAALIQARQQTVQVVRELPHPTRELFHCHRTTPARPEYSGP